jgi:crotonobetainyl-CoA:carnitine CoA-transferase CaiB-like acyl-CoA transferase
MAVAAEPFVDFEIGEQIDDAWRPTPERPLSGLRVLDCTRILAGPVATRFLAGYGAEVLRIDPPGWDEGGGGQETTLGKRMSYLDLRTDAGRDRFLELMSRADLFIHGYRPNALESLGLGAAVRAAARPGLIEVTLDAYGWSGPWRERRGFDTLVQISSGIAIESMHWAKADRPKLMPAQVLDHGTGYFIAAAALRGLTTRLATGRGSRWRLALARTAAMLVNAGVPPTQPTIEQPVTGPVDERVFSTAWGPARRLRSPIVADGVPWFWERAADLHGSAAPIWVTRPRAGRTQQ